MWTSEYKANFKSSPPTTFPLQRSTRKRNRNDTAVGDQVDDNREFVDMFKKVSGAPDSENETEEFVAKIKKRGRPRINAKVNNNNLRIFKNDDRSIFALEHNSNSPCLEKTDEGSSDYNIKTLRQVTLSPPPGQVNRSFQKEFDTTTTSSPVHTPVKDDRIMSTSSKMISSEAAQSSDISTSSTGELLSPPDPGSPHVIKNRDASAGFDLESDMALGYKVPGDTVPGDTLPGDALPGDTVPGDTVPGDTVPGDMVPLLGTGRDVKPLVPIHAASVTRPGVPRMPRPPRPGVPRMLRPPRPGMSSMLRPPRSWMPSRIRSPRPGMPSMLQPPRLRMSNPDVMSNVPRQGGVRRPLAGAGPRISNPRSLAVVERNDQRVSCHVSSPYPVIEIPDSPPRSDSSPQAAMNKLTSLGVTIAKQSSTHHPTQGWSPPPGISVTRTAEQGPCLSISSLAAALHQLGQVEGRRRIVQFRLTESQVKALYNLGLKQE